MIRNFATLVNGQKVILRYEASSLERETGLEPAAACLGDIAVSCLCVFCLFKSENLFVVIWWVIVYNNQNFSC